MQQNSNRPTPGQLVKSRHTLRLFLVLQVEVEPAPGYADWDIKVWVLDHFGVVRVWLFLDEEWDRSILPVLTCSG